MRVCLLLGMLFFSAVSLAANESTSVTTSTAVMGASVESVDREIDVEQPVKDQESPNASLGY